MHQVEINLLLCVILEEFVVYPFIFFFKCAPDVRDSVAGSRPLRKVPHSVGKPRSHFWFRPTCQR